MEGTVQNFQIFVKPAGSRCNLNCGYCYYLQTAKLYPARAKGELRMTAALLEEYISQHIRACQSENVHFSWHGGEPTLLGLDYFRQIVRLQRKHCPPGRYITNGIQTNGTLLDAEWARFLAKHCFQVGLSIDGPADIHDVYRRSRQGRGSHVAVMRGYRSLMEHGVGVDILCVVNDYNVMYPLQVYRFFTDIGAKFISFLPLVESVESDSGPVVSERSVNPEAFGAFLCTIFDAWLAGGIGAVKIQIFEEALRTAFGQEHSLCLFRPVCGAIAVLEYNGDIYACDHFVDPRWHLGNIRQTELADILRSPALKAFGEAKRDRLPTICRGCEVLAMCNGECPKNRVVAVAGEAEKQNYLCAGYRLFFNHCRPFVEAVSRQWHLEQGK